jgi:hypothetical protein
MTSFPKMFLLWRFSKVNESTQHQPDLSFKKLEFPYCNSLFSEHYGIKKTVILPASQCFSIIVARPVRVSIDVSQVLCFLEKLNLTNVLIEVV